MLCDLFIERERIIRWWKDKISYLEDIDVIGENSNLLKQEFFFFFFNCTTYDYIRYMLHDLHLYLLLTPYLHYINLHYIRYMLQYHNTSQMEL